MNDKHMLVFVFIVLLLYLAVGILINPLAGVIHSVVFLSAVWALLYFNKE